MNNVAPDPCSRHWHEPSRSLFNEDLVAQLQSPSGTASILDIHLTQAHAPSQDNVDSMTDQSGI